jgi:hypothetical protein
MRVKSTDTPSARVFIKRPFYLELVPKGETLPRIFMFTIRHQNWGSSFKEAVHRILTSECFTFYCVRMEVEQRAEIKEPRH